MTPRAPRISPRAHSVIVERLRTQSRADVARETGLTLSTIEKIARANKIRDAERRAA